MNVCECCGQKYGRLPPGSWMSHISKRHRVRIRTHNCDNEEIGCGNDPAVAVEEAWEWWYRMAKKELRRRKRRKVVEVEEGESSH